MKILKTASCFINVNDRTYGGIFGFYHGGWDEGRLEDVAGFHNLEVMLPNNPYLIDEQRVLARRRALDSLSHRVTLVEVGAITNSEVSDGVYWNLALNGALFAEPFDADLLNNFAGTFTGSHQNEENQRYEAGLSFLLKTDNFGVSFGIGGAYNEVSDQIGRELSFYVAIPLGK